MDLCLGIQLPLIPGCGGLNVIFLGAVDVACGETGFGVRGILLLAWR